MSKPKTPEEIADIIKNPDTKIVFASQDGVDALGKYTDLILKQIGIRSAWISDESCFSDFACDEAEVLDLLKYFKVDESIVIANQFISGAIDRLTHLYLVDVARAMRDIDINKGEA